ncbi:MAG: DUF1569 domain-containing protein [Rubinisphaera brasiliensis]|uniref:DUF1569 domain-containing protein n=1 Tax=Rubinisphaera brasiliensis TaxID=119 RepID=UPI00391899FE
MSDLRFLQFSNLDDAIDEAQRLLASGYVAHGNWSLGQICSHLRLVQDPSVEGYPTWMSMFAFLRPIMRRTLMPRALSADPPRGIRTMSSFQPGNDLDDAEEVERFVASVKRFQNHEGAYYAHPAFGRLDPQQLEQVHAAHAAHHLRFLMPRSH